MRASNGAESVLAALCAAASGHSTTQTSHIITSVSGRSAGILLLYSHAFSPFTKTDTTAKAVDPALETLKRLGERGISAEQLASAKAYIMGTCPSQRLETADQIASVLRELELYRLGRDEIDNLFLRIEAVKLEQANAAKIREAAAGYAPRVIEVSVTRPGFAAYSYNDE